jgi:hypothetical protein
VLGVGAERSGLQASKPSQTIKTEYFMIDSKDGDLTHTND